MFCSAQNWELSAVCVDAMPRGLPTLHLAGELASLSFYTGVNTVNSVPLSVTGVTGSERAQFEVALGLFLNTHRSSFC